MSPAAAPAPGAIELPEIAEAVEKIEKKMAELEPSVIAYNSYQEAITRLTGNTPIRSTRAASAPRPAASASRGRRLGREEQFVELVKAEPGQIISYYANKMEVQPNYLYRVRDKAKGNGLIRQDGANIYPVTDEDRIADRARELEAAGSK